MITKNSKIFIAGHKGMVGSAVWDRLTDQGYTNLVGRSRHDLNLLNQEDVREFIQTERLDVVIDCAARVGGIMANNSFPYQFLMENMQMQNNLIDESFKANVKNFIFLGSSCIYPKFAAQPIKEEYLLTDSLEPTNQWYAIAKISGVMACEAIRNQYGANYLSLMPTNLYGPRDNFDLTSSHVLPAMIRKFHEAKLNGDRDVILWGSGTPMREFLFVNDLAEAVVFFLKYGSPPEGLYNVGTGKDITIKSLAMKIQEIVGHKGNIIWDSTKPDGTPRKLLDVSKLQDLGWSSNTTLDSGIRSTYEWFLENIESLKEIKL